jgi:enamine deaminase RidA (YjgF/YER057c/UK114 family)
MELIAHNPADGIYTTPGLFIHAVEVRGADRLLFVTGTLGIDPDGGVPDIVEEQLEWVWDNIRTILAAADMTVDNIVKVTSYLTDAADTPANAAARDKALGGRRVAATGIVTQLIDSAWLVEVEVVAAA